MASLRDIKRASGGSGPPERYNIQAIIQAARDAYHNPTEKHTCDDGSIVDKQWLELSDTPECRQKFMLRRKDNGQHFALPPLAGSIKAAILKRVKNGKIQLNNEEAIYIDATDAVCSVEVYPEYLEDTQPEKATEGVTEPLTMD